MLTLNGIYDGNGITLQEAVPFKEQCKVMVTFLKNWNPSAPSSESASATARTESAARPAPEFKWATPEETPEEERLAAVNRLAGLLKGSTITLEEARAERLARK